MEFEEFGLLTSKIIVGSGGKVSKHCSALTLMFFFSADCRYGQSLVVTAISEGRQAARQIDLDLMGETSLAGVGGQIHTTRPPPRQTEF